MVFAASNLKSELNSLNDSLLSKNFSGFVKVSFNKETSNQQIQEFATRHNLFKIEKTLELGYSEETHKRDSEIFKFGNLNGEAKSIMSLDIQRNNASAENPISNSYSEVTLQRSLRDYQKTKLQQIFDEWWIADEVEVFLEEPIKGESYVNISFIDDAQEQQIQEFISKYNLTKIEENFKLDIKIFKLGNLFDKKGEPISANIQQEIFKNLKLIKNVELLQNYHAGDYTPTKFIESVSVKPFTSAARFGEQWGLYNTKYPNQDINIGQAWEITKGSKDVVLAVVDTGVDSNHPSLQNQISENNNDSTDLHGHGTAVAGVIAADDTKGEVAGVAPGIKLFPIKFNNGNINNFFDEALGKSYFESAVDLAIANGASIINMSFGVQSNQDMQVVRKGLDKASAAGILVVAGAGNSCKNIDIEKFYPASFTNEYDNIITVTSFQENGTFNNSTFGCGDNYGRLSVTLAAPGVNILVPKNQGGYDTTSGTSFATPHVAGTAALMKSVNPNITPQQIIATIKETVTPDFSLKRITQTGGRLNAGKAVQQTLDNMNKVL